jgi:peptidoglycan-N-acetylglucosamine deacetylase
MRPIRPALQSKSATAGAGLAVALLLIQTATAAPAPPPSSPARVGQLITRGPDSSRRIALTFDDGPGTDTVRFVELLDRYHVRATFFVLGQYVERNPATVRKLVERGHEIGSHSYGHTNYQQHYKQLVSRGVKSGNATERARQDLLTDLRQTQAVIQNQSGARVTLCRMPYGIDRPWIRDVAREMGYTLVNWTYGADWKPGAARTLMPGYLSAIKPGAILLLHDGVSNRSVSLALAEAIIRSAKDQGYEIVTVSELLGDRPGPRSTASVTSTAAH